MPSLRQRRWRAQNEQQALVEYALLRKHRPEGIYCVPNPHNPLLWSGILFVRTGPYAPAALRFEVDFSPPYPDHPPVIAFTTDIFHPLVTPLTTHTLASGNAAVETPQAARDGGLPPGGFSLRYGFPGWLKKPQGPNSPGSPTGDVFEMDEDGGDVVGFEEFEPPTRSPFRLSKQFFHMSPPKADLPRFLGPEKATPSIVEVLHYVKRTFENEDLLNAMPLASCANSGAWNAWMAHSRAKQRSAQLKAEAKAAKAAGTPYSSPKRDAIRGAPDAPSGWNWDGVWAERVRVGIGVSLSEGELFGKADGEDLADIEAEDHEELRTKILPTS